LKVLKFAAGSRESVVAQVSEHDARKTWGLVEIFLSGKAVVIVPGLHSTD
jgi:hypothetical protein